MTHETATREVLWNIEHAWLMYALLVPTLGVAFLGFYRRVRAWRRGRPEARFDQPLRRLGMLARGAVLQLGVWRKRLPGLYHAAIFWGMMTLTIATTVVMLDYDFGLPIMRGKFYLYFQSLFVDLMGLAAIAGCVAAMARRWIARPKELVYTLEASVLLVTLLAILVTGFVIEGLRIAATNDPWGAWSPIGRAVARSMDGRISLPAMLLAHKSLWWSHLGLTFALFAYAPFTKLAHAVTAPLNIYTARLVPSGGALRPLDFEREGSLGVKTLADFTWKDLLDLDACTECGRCTAVCPANATGKRLSPRDIILDLRSLMHGPGAGPEELVGAKPALEAEAMWQCTTCGACMDACPVAIDQMPKIVDLRRYLAMELAEMPETMQAAMKSLEDRGHPLAGSQSSRMDWADGLDVPTIEEEPNPDVLLWVGCGGALVERNQKVTRALARLLAKAGVKFAVMGRAERCTGDPARRMGNEFLFDRMARENVETLNRHNVRTIVTACAHCFNTLGNEYGDFGGKYEVFHHTQYLRRLVDEGKLRPTESGEARRVAFHDPCYLGRHNGEFDAPRRLVELSTSSPAIELKRNRRDGFCCGGGGGMSFVDELPDQRVNRERAREIVDSGADVVAVGCPFCMTMLEDGVNACKGDRDIAVRDVAELLWENINQTPTTETVS